MNRVSTVDTFFSGPSRPSCSYTAPSRHLGHDLKLSISVLSSNYGRGGWRKLPPTKSNLNRPIKPKFSAPPTAKAIPAIYRFSILFSGNFPDCLRVEAVWVR